MSGELVIRVLSKHKHIHAPYNEKLSMAVYTYLSLQCQPKRVGLVVSTTLRWYVIPFDLPEHHVSEWC